MPQPTWRWAKNLQPGNAVVRFHDSDKDLAEPLIVTEVEIMTATPFGRPLGRPILVRIHFEGHDCVHVCSPNLALKTHMTKEDAYA